MAPPKKGFNRHKIEGDTTIIYLETKKGEVIEALIDTEDLEKVKATDYSFHATWKKGVGSYYVRTTIYKRVDGKRKCGAIYLHHLIMPLPLTETVLYHVDHKNHNTLDNRKENLEIKLAKVNHVNRKKANKNNKSGYRNVSFTDNNYIVQLQIDGKNTRLASFKDAQEAGEYAEAMREKYYGKDATFKENA
ncbi:hypothetical protein Elgi_38060 [Paenibacillus elgii]|uniref:hypothetical protein n=1 Tax=Paenibacillus elgii TaxID=189691 RepID=UPI002D7B7938|nr:hypothetical protein Elgi_38060 [Paenibacillus elgii]